MSFHDRLIGTRSDNGRGYSTEFFEFMVMTLVEEVVKLLGVMRLNLLRFVMAVKQALT